MPNNVKVSTVSGTALLCFIPHTLTVPAARCKQLPRASAIQTGAKLALGTRGEIDRMGCVAVTSLGGRLQTVTLTFACPKALRGAAHLAGQVHRLIVGVAKGDFDGSNCVEMNVSLWEGDRDVCFVAQFVDRVPDFALYTQPLHDGPHLDPEMDFEMQGVVAKLPEQCNRLGLQQDVRICSHRFLQQFR